MSFQSVVGAAMTVPILLSFSPNPSLPAPGVQFSYDQGRMTATVVGQQVQGKPILYVHDFYNGLRPSTANIVEVGFLDPKGCDHPNFLADNQRVVPSSVAEFVSGKEIEELRTSQGVKPSTFVYNFYTPSQVQQIASAKSVQYEICDSVYTLSSPDQSYLQQFLSKLKS